MEEFIAVVVVCSERKNISKQVDCLSLLDFLTLEKSGRLVGNPGTSHVVFVLTDEPNGARLYWYLLVFCPFHSV